MILRKGYPFPMLATEFLRIFSSTKDCCKGTEWRGCMSCRYYFCGAKMVPNPTKPPYTEIQRHIRLYAENLYFKPFLRGFINTYGEL